MAGRRLLSLTISYAFTIPVLVSNLVILGVLGFLISGTPEIIDIVHESLIDRKLVHTSGWRNRL
jgi:hypothetical protein